jgi:hypothetical protein
MGRFSELNCHLRVSSLGPSLVIYSRDMATVRERQRARTTPNALVMGIAFVYLGNLEKARDLVHETFARAWHHLRSQIAVGPSEQ